ncbi:hypothetical protein JVU11DRAFT_3981 [Chiua virens]|nr:hypothetical protein JVU11DRAFT_3981 [Chiua virens]
MHAAASYGQLDVLAYLVQQGNSITVFVRSPSSTILCHLGGDVNITDEDGDTPLYTVENIDTARWLVDHGAAIDRRNSEGVSPIDHLIEDFPDVAAYLHSRLHPSAPPPVPSPDPQPSQHSQNAASETLTSNLIQSVSDIMQRAEAEGRDPDEELRGAVNRTVLEGVLAGYDLSNQDHTDSDTEDQLSKRPRMNGSSH